MYQPLVTYLSPTPPHAPCPKTMSDLYSLRPSNYPLWCEIFLPLKDYSVSGYHLLFPSVWTVRIAGAEGMNLLFNEGKKSEVFLQVTETTLPLEQATQATDSFESRGPMLLIDPQEKIITKILLSIGDKHVLRVSTTKEDQTYVRYFLKHTKNDQQAFYVFRIQQDDQELEHIVESMIASMVFTTD